MNTQVIRSPRYWSALVERKTNRLSNVLPRAFRQARKKALDLVDWFKPCQQRASDREVLRGLGAHERLDLGRTRANVLVEADKPFWRT
jgi:uncharacterized protein YjiS (DUF1127 family)